MSHYFRGSTSQPSFVLTGLDFRIECSRCLDNRLTKGPDIKEAVFYILFRQYRSSIVLTAQIVFSLHLEQGDEPMVLLLICGVQANQEDQISRAGKSHMGES